MESENLISEDEILDYLNLRKNVINGVTISGGEPTLQPDLKDFIIKVKSFGLDVKLDTNGINYNVLKELIDEKLVDYVAMDIKNTFEKYAKTSGLAKINEENILKSINLLKQNKVDYEFRTTVINEYHTLQDILEIIKLIGDSKYYLQNFKNSAYVIDKSLTEVTEEKLILWNQILKKHTNVFIRGMEKGE
jgi:pyruvate formate lyase activating enzyme